VIKNPLIQNLKRDYIDLDKKHAELREEYGHKHPDMPKLEREKKNLRSRIIVEVKNVAKSEELEYRMLVAKEKSLQGALDEAKKEVMGLNKKAIQYGVLKREVESNREIYNMILRRAKETALTSRLKSTNMFVVDQAEVPRRSINPPFRKKVLMGLVVGLMIGVGLAIFLENWDRTLHGPSDVKRFLGVPFLGPVGLFSPNGTDKTTYLVTLRDPKSGISEAIRNIRTNLVLSFDGPRDKTLVVTSPGPVEGKTFISSNLAVTMAGMERGVVLVDADMRKPAANKVFGTTTEPGLSNLILGECTLNETIRKTLVEHLAFIPAGSSFRDPSELLGSEKMRTLLRCLRDRFDYVIFDSPPILAAADAAVLSAMLDGTVLVLKASGTPREAAKEAIEQLKDVQARAIGVVLNQVDFRRERHHYNYQYYYKDYYYYADRGEKSRRRIRRGQKGRETPG
jgi:capsular exopolysaccharide synthesis family protein